MVCKLHLNEIVKKKKHTQTQNFPQKGEAGRVAIRRKPLKRFFDESVMEKKREKPCLGPKKKNFILNLCIPSSNIHDDTVHLA